MAALRLAFTASAVALATSFAAPHAGAQADAAMPNPSCSPDENPPNPAQVTLGKFLFWEEQMSFTNTMACGTCHIHEAGGSDPRAVQGTHPGPDGIFGNDDDIAGSPGVVLTDFASQTFTHGSVFFPNVEVTGRKSPTAINAGSFDTLFWDGRAEGEFIDPVTGEVAIQFGGALESQAAGPPLSEVEMGSVGFGWEDIEDKLEKVRPMALATDLPPEMADFLDDNPRYPDMFAAAYSGDPTITARKIAFAIANYERTLVSDETMLDKVLKNEIAELPPELDAGFQLFSLDANCTSCHVLPFLANGNFFNIGVRPDSEDSGREGFTGDPSDVGKFKTPNFRNAKLRTPLFHNGGKATVREVVEFYNNGGDFPGPNTDPEIFPLNLTQQQIDDLVLFIEDGLTDPRVENREFPFTRPTLRSELASPNTVYGVASLNGSGEAMTVIANNPATTNQPFWLFGVDNATPNELAFLAFATDDDPNGTPFPDIRFPVPMNIVPSSIFTVVNTVTDAFGVGTASLSFPNNANLIGMTFYSQMFVTDAAALATGGIYGSEGTEIVVF